LSASTLTIWTSPGVRICFCETLRFSLFWSKTIPASLVKFYYHTLGRGPKEYRRNSTISASYLTQLNKGKTLSQIDSLGVSSRAPQRSAASPSRLARDQTALAIRSPVLQSSLAFRYTNEKLSPR
jgi:hypothetical protein